MRKLRRFFVSLIIILTSFDSEAIEDHKTIDEVRNEFTRLYTYSTVEYGLNFAKKRDDWYVIQYGLGDRAVVNEFLFWNSSSHKFMPLSFDAVHENERVSLDPVTSIQRYFYQIMPYYGYEAYFIDNINYLRNKEPISNDELYVLSRCYSEYTGGLLVDQYGNAAKQLLFNPTFYKQNSLTDEQLKTYLRYHDSCFMMYSKLKQRDPNYNTRLVGSVSNKLSNEYIYEYYNLSMFQNEETALKYLPDNLYNDFTLGYAKNFLDDCPSKAILFVEGDNDTYPLIYLQAKKHYRQDITIINVSLLGLAIYSNYLADTKKVGLKSYFNQDEIEKFLYTRIINDGNKELTFDEYVAATHSIANFANEYETGATVNCSLLTMKHGRKVIKILPNSIMYKNDNLLLDILASNNFVRPICIGLFSDPEHITSKLIPYSNESGFVHIVNQIEKIEPYGLVNFDTLYTNIVKQYQYKIPEIPLRSDNFVSDAYKVIFIRAMNYAGLEKKNKTKFDSLVAMYERLFPLSKFNVSEQDINFALLISYHGDKKKAVDYLTLCRKSVDRNNYLDQQDFDDFITRIDESIQSNK